MGNKTNWNGVVKVAVLKGGISSEREVSLVSGEECARALRSCGYDVTEIDVTRDLWIQLENADPDVVFQCLARGLGRGWPGSRRAGYVWQTLHPFRSHGLCLGDG